MSETKISWFPNADEPYYARFAQENKMTAVPLEERKVFIKLSDVVPVVKKKAQIKKPEKKSAEIKKEKKIEKKSDNSDENSEAAEDNTTNNDMMAELNAAMDSDNKEEDDASSSSSSEELTDDEFAKRMIEDVRKICTYVKERKDEMKSGEGSEVDERVVGQKVQVALRSSKLSRKNKFMKISSHQEDRDKEGGDDDDEDAELNERQLAILEVVYPDFHESELVFDDGETSEMEEYLQKRAREEEEAENDLLETYTEEETKEYMKKKKKEFAVKENYLKQMEKNADIEEKNCAGLLENAEALVQANDDEENAYDEDDYFIDSEAGSKRKVGTNPRGAVVVDPKLALKKSGKGLAALKRSRGNTTSGQKKTSFKKALVCAVDSGSMSVGASAVPEKKEKKKKEEEEEDGADYIHRRLLDIDAIDKIEACIIQVSDLVKRAALCAISEALLNVVAIDYPVLYETTMKTATKIKPKMIEAERNKVPLSVFCRSNSNWLIPKTTPTPNVRGMRLVDVVFTLLRMDEMKDVYWRENVRVDCNFLSSHLTRGLVGEHVGVRRVLGAQEVELLKKCAPQQSRCAVSGDELCEGDLVLCEAFSSSLVEDRAEYEESLKSVSGDLRDGIGSEILDFEKAYSPHQTSAADLTAPILCYIKLATKDQQRMPSPLVVEKKIGNKQNCNGTAKDVLGPASTHKILQKKLNNNSSIGMSGKEASENEVAKNGNVSNSEFEEMDINEENDDDDNEEMDEEEEEEKEEEEEEKEEEEEEREQVEKKKVKKEKNNEKEEDVTKMGDEALLAKCDEIEAQKGEVLKEMEKLKKEAQKWDSKRKEFELQLKTQKEELKNSEDGLKKIEDQLQKLMPDDDEEEDSDTMALIEKKKAKKEEFVDSLESASTSIGILVRALESARKRKTEAYAEKNKLDVDERKRLLDLLRPYADEKSRRGGKKKMGKKRKVEAVKPASPVRAIVKKKKSEESATKKVSAPFSPLIDDSDEQVTAATKKVIKGEDDSKMAAAASIKRNGVIAAVLASKSSRRSLSSSSSPNTQQVVTENALSSVNWMKVSSMDARTTHSLSSAKGTKNNIHTYNVAREVAVLGDGFDLMISNSETVKCLDEATLHFYTKQQFGLGSAEDTSTVNVLLAGRFYDKAEEADEVKEETLNLEKKIIDKKMQKANSAKTNKLTAEETEKLREALQSEMDQQCNLKSDEYGLSQRTTSSHLLQKIRTIEDTLNHNGEQLYDVESFKCWLVCIASLFTHPTETLHLKDGKEYKKLEDIARDNQLKEPFTSHVDTSWEDDHAPIPANHLPFGRHLTSNETLLYLIRCVQQALFVYVQDLVEEDDKADALTPDKLFSLVKDRLWKESALNERGYNAEYTWNEMRAYNERSKLKEQYEKERKEFVRVREELGDSLKKLKKSMGSNKTKVFMNHLFPHHY